MKYLLKSVALAVTLLAASHVAQAAVYTTSFGADAGNVSNCDDCFSGPWDFTGVGQSINFFGTTYSGLFVGSNGYVTFGAGRTNFSTQPLDTQTVGPMIAGSFTDLDSRSDAASNVFVNSTTPGQLVVTWQDMGQFPQNYSVRSTFQLVIRSDQYAVPAGEGQIGFFYGDITDGTSTSAGFGDGLSASNPGEEAFLSQGDGRTLSNSDPRWFILGNNGVPTAVDAVPEPGSLSLLALGALAVGVASRRKARSNG